MRRLYPLWRFIAHNKYWIVVVVCVCVVGFLDENSMLQHTRNQMVIRDLKAQIEEYNSRYERDEAKLKELKRNPKAITKIARENYFMKADDEDIFVLSDDENNVKSNETVE
ncbi:MAG: septum formation initiator family protein [Prevotellaceae bacterium]|nr:septum formation initiator family protein [Prevotellaceae bacterium]